MKSEELLEAIVALRLKIASADRHSAFGISVPTESLRKVTKAAEKWASLVRRPGSERPGVPGQYDVANGAMRVRSKWLYEHEGWYDGLGCRHDAPEWWLDGSLPPVPTEET